MRKPCVAASPWRSAPHPPASRASCAGRLAAIAALALASVALGACSTPGAGSDPGKRAPRPLRVLSYNVRHGAGMDDIVNLERAAAVIRTLAPDVVALQEIDDGCGRTGGVDQARRLGQLCGMHAAFGPFMDYDGGRYGMALLSRAPFVAVENHVLPPGSEPRSALAARVRVGGDDDGGGGRELLVVGIHLYETEAERLAQAQAVLDAVAGEDAPVFLVGDFNSARGSAVMRLLETRFANPPKDGPANTFPADAPEREIDFVLLRPAERFDAVRVRVVDERVASDHRPIVLDAELR